MNSISVIYGRLEEQNRGQWEDEKAQGNEK